MESDKTTVWLNRSDIWYVFILTNNYEWSSAGNHEVTAQALSAELI